MRRAYIADLRAIWPLTARIGVANAPPWHQSWPEKTVIWVMSVHTSGLPPAGVADTIIAILVMGRFRRESPPVQKVTPRQSKIRQPQPGGIRWHIRFHLKHHWKPARSCRRAGVCLAMLPLPRLLAGRPACAETAMGFCSGARRLPAPFFSRRWHWDWSRLRQWRSQPAAPAVPGSVVMVWRNGQCHDGRRHGRRERKRRALPAAVAARESRAAPAVPVAR